MILELRNLTKIFTARGKPTVRAVDDVSLSIPEGATFGLLGESGSGKSTLARLITRLMEPTSGALLYQGQDLLRLHERDLRAVREQIQIVFQNPFSSLNPRMTVRQLIGEPLVVHKRASGAALENQVCDTMSLVGLNPEHTNRFPHEFSGGQRQRIGIARALILHPKLLILDEPTSALDVSVQAQILNLLAELRRDLGLTYLFISHNLAVVEHVASEVAVMYLGRIVEKKPTQALFHAPEHPYTKALLASVLTPEPGLGVPDVGLGDVMPDPANIPPGCRFHPRCPIAEPRCSVETPPLRPRPGGGVECLLVP